MLFSMVFSQKLVLLGIVLLAGILFFTGIDWGLPSRDADSYLFGSRLPWTGQQIMQLAGEWETDSSRGADIAMHPLQGRDQPVVLNDTDAKRAEIVRRYRLYSNQPDEMITFRSLSRMKPARLNLDPGLYQYGGLWIYPVGVLLKLGSLAHLITLRTDLAFYLDHPEAFGQFYLVARFYSAAWGLLGVLVVFALGRELTGCFLVGAIAAGIYCTMPVVIDLAHEAKPHLAGTVLALTTLWAAARYVRSGSRKAWIAAGLFAGASMGIVLTGYVAFAALGVMTLLRSMSWTKRLRITAAAGVVGIAVFALTNPYLPFNLLFHRGVLHSNVGNYGTFYRPGISVAGLRIAGKSLLTGMSIGPLVSGLLGVIVCITRRQAKALLPAAVAILVLIQFVLLAEGKTAEYARFALTVDVIFGLSTAYLVSALPITRREKSLAGLLLVGSTLYFGLRYDLNFIADNGPHSTRREAAETLAVDSHQSSILTVDAEPAPYCLPPVDLFHWQIVLQPREVEKRVTGALVVSGGPVDEPGKINPLAPPRAISPISWANKPFEVNHE